MAGYNFPALQKNIIDTVQEFQIKLGGMGGPIGLYYPLDSLNRLIGASLDEAGMTDALHAFADWAKDRLGPVGISNEGARFCLRLPDKGVAYAREHGGDTAFLRDFIALVSRFGATFDDIEALFRRYDENAACEKLAGGEFDALFYFPAGQPDDYRYCVKFEGGMATYHRFTAGDYEALRSDE